MIAVRAYVRRVTARLLSLLALVALLLMPLGFSAPASAAAAPSAVAMEHDGHCPPQPEPGGKSLPGSHCVTGCALVLPDQAGVPATRAFAPRPHLQASSTSLAGRHPDIVTPPPKQS
jgi:hypothetical protein